MTTISEKKRDLKKTETSLKRDRGRTYPANTYIGHSMISNIQHKPKPIVVMTCYDIDPDTVKLFFRPLSDTHTNMINTDDHKNTHLPNKSPV